MTDLEKCNEMVRSFLGEKYVRIWWSTRNKGFDGVTPEEVFMVDPTRVLHHLITITQEDNNES